jgi:hypothetical protein
MTCPRRPAKLTPRLRVIDEHSELLATAPRHSTGEISRFKAYGSTYAANGLAGGR